MLESYIKTKLSQEDKKILKEIYEELEQINIRVSYDTSIASTKWGGHTYRTGTYKQKKARQTCFGKTSYQGKSRNSASSKKYPHMMSLFKKFIDQHKPEFKFKGVYVNKNTICQKHLDSRNTGESLLVGLGPYTFGRTVLYINNKKKKFHIKSNSLLFNGSLIEHKSEPFKGIRYSLVFFKRNKCI